jgi:hypothetical protein
MNPQVVNDSDHLPKSKEDFRVKISTEDVTFSTSRKSLPFEYHKYGTLGHHQVHIKSTLKILENVHL